MRKKIEDGIYREEDGTFSVRVATSFGGYKQKTKRGIGRLQDAKYYKRKFKEELDDRIYRIRNRVVTWKIAKEEYFAQAEFTLRPSTLIECRKSLNAHTKVWDDLPLEKMNKMMITKRIQKVHKNNSESTKIQLAKYIKNVLKVQVDCGELIKNPATGIKFSTKRLKWNKLQAMTKSEIEFFFKKAKEYDHPWYPVWYVVYQAGLRSGEGLALRKTCLDFDNDRIHIVESFDTKVKEIGPTKNREPRVVPMNKELKLFLKEYLLTKTDSEFVLPRISAWMRGEAARNLRQFQREIGIRETNFHSLRASFITHLLLSGVPMIKVQMLVGHQDLKTTARYVRLVASDLEGVTDAIGIDLGDAKAAEVLDFQAAKKRYK